MRGEPSLGRRDVHCTRLVPIPLTNVEDDVLRRRSPLELPLLGSNQDSPDPVPLRLSPPLHERSWSGLCLHLRPYAVRWLPPSLYTFPSRGLARRCQSRVRRLREHSRTSFPASCPASAPSGAARVRRVASYTKGQRYYSSASDLARTRFILLPTPSPVNSDGRPPNGHRLG